MLLITGQILNNCHQWRQTCLQLRVIKDFWKWIVQRLPKDLVPAWCSTRVRGLHHHHRGIRRCYQLKYRCNSVVNHLILRGGISELVTKPQINHLALPKLMLRNFSPKISYFRSWHSRVTTTVVKHQIIR